MLGSFRVDLGMSPRALSQAVNGLEARFGRSPVEQDHAKRVYRVAGE